MNVFEFRDRLIADYSSYVRSFIRIRDEGVKSLVDDELEQGLLWPDPLIQLNPSFERGNQLTARRRPWYAVSIEPTPEGGVRVEVDEGRAAARRQYKPGTIHPAQTKQGAVLSTGMGKHVRSDARTPSVTNQIGKSDRPKGE